MALLYAKERLYHTVDRKEVVKEGDPRAAFLLMGEGVAMPEEQARRLGITEFMESENPQGTPVERERALLADAEARGAHYEAQARRAAVDRLEHGENPAGTLIARAPDANIPPPNLPLPNLPLPAPASGEPKAQRRAAAAAESDKATAAAAAEAKK
jgi:hypothetical protein